MKKVISFVFLSLVSFGGMTMFVSAGEREACAKLSSDAKQEVIGYFITPSQKEMCDANSIAIDAPVRE